MKVIGRKTEDIVFKKFEIIELIENVADVNYINLK